MDPPSKKRSIFGFTQLFRGSPAPPDSRDAKMEQTTKLAAPAQPQREFTNASAPHSPVKRASDSQLASRKLIGRPQGPSSKLSQSISASDFTHRPTTTTIATHRRMPGDNPNKPLNAMSASVVSHAPVNIIPKSTSFSGVSSTPRHVFRSSALYSRPGLQSYASRPPLDTLNQSFPPATPGKPSRGSSTADVNGRILANTASTELFAMRIPSPPRHLTGEMLAKEVPDDPNRSGSVYADEFLAHYCPPDLDEHQRRQFFCILDLRRLKYAADEVFTKKDWKINILNFAKEYEKSRSLIMLRYGLYEFKTVRASEAVKKEWKQKHGIPDSGDESEAAPKLNGVSSKRKAEEELTPSSINPLATSVSGANKRARAPEPSVKNKRKADSEPGEKHPAKLQKPAAPPSATKSVFESIANNAQSTPAKPAGKSLFASGATLKPNGSLGMSVFGAPKPAAASGNIFGHLSDGSKGSGNEGADEDSETSSNIDEDESEPQDVSQSDEPAASGGVSTPQFLAGAQKPTMNGTSATSSDAGDSSQGRSIFDRITKGSDGQPVRKLSPEDGNLFAAPAVNERSVSPTKELPAAAPGNNTWNAGTPIKFAGAAAPAFGSAVPKASATATIDFGAAGFNKTPATSSDAPKETATQSLFGAQTKKADDVAAPSTTNGATSSLFSFGAKTANTPAAAPLFGGLGAGASTATPMFGGAAVSKFGQQKEKDDAKDVSAPAPSTTTSLFGVQPAAAPAPSSNNVFQSSLFGNQNNNAEAAPASQPPFGNLFTNTQTTDAQPEKKVSQPTSSLFAANAKPSTNLLFGAAAPSSSSAEEPAAKKFAFGTSENKSGGSLFGSGASTPAAEPTETKSLFGAAAPAAAPSTETKSLFGAMTAAPASETKSLFGATTAAPPTKSLFGATATTPATESKNLFGGAATTAAPETKSLFGATSAAPATQSKSLFGAAAPAPAQEARPLFGAAAESKPLFGNTTTTGSTNAKPAGLFANPPAAAPASSSIFSFGATQTPVTTQPATSQPGSSIFGATGSTSFTFSAGTSDASTIKNPFSSEGTYSAPSSFNFGSGEPASSSAPFAFGSSSTPSISFGGAPDSGAQQPTSGSMFSFGGASQQPSSAPVFSQNPPAATIFGSSLAPGGGTSTGTNSPFTFGGASSLATTPAATTPEPAANAEDAQGTNADGDEAPQEQISLTDGGPGEEDESAVYEVRAKAVKLVTGGGDSDDESGKKSAAPAWKVQGVGPLRLLKNKTTGAARMLLRAEPRGNVALNKAVLPSFSYKADAKYVKLTTATDDGKGLETWMLQVKTVELAKTLAEKLEENKGGNKK
ncbi:hypothetical protein C8A05DRAFT_37355 [Staphylotrichum tortipilum]|uniref:RanBD1 domain-containing protein n=1 Tax=Staphylotrichum tortipilum TaxID=2831512 RepID=A0AAN6MF93_9PEZI|nr:hypothetical protein C8A05DRAFT_37355 [Staphylotrichum longicolle]